MRTRAFGMFALLCAVLALCLGGCSQPPEEDAYGSKDASAELRIVMDATLEGAWVPDGGGFEGGGTAEEGSLENLSFAQPAVADADAGVAEVEAAIGADPSLDMVFARGTVVDALAEDGYVESNATALNTAQIPVLDNVYLEAARAEGSDDVELPETRLVSGDDDASSKEWRLAYLGDWGGTVAVGPENTLSGQAFNQALASVGLYSAASGQGGSYDASIADKVKVAKSAADALARVRDGKADVAFVYTFDLDGTDDVESFYQVPIELYALRPDYKGAVLAQSANKSAARWYLNVLYKQI